MFENIYKDKRVLITGHTGFKGSWLCAWLLDLGATVAGYSFDVPTEPSHFKALDLAKKYEQNAFVYCQKGQTIEVVITKLMGTEAQLLTMPFFNSVHD